jgi:hypothetical protein
MSDSEVAERKSMKTGIELIADERNRQVSVEGWTPAHDDEHDCGELADAAVVYTLEAGERLNTKCIEFVSHWPWALEWWKPSPDPVRNLVKAGALIAAEIDRLQRLSSQTHD